MVRNRFGWLPLEAWKKPFNIAKMRVRCLWYFTHLKRERRVCVWETTNFSQWTTDLNTRMYFMWRAEMHRPKKKFIMSHSSWGGMLMSPQCFYNCLVAYKVTGTKYVVEKLSNPYVGLLWDILFCIHLIISNDLSFAQLWGTLSYPVPMEQLIAINTWWCLVSVAW